MKKIIAFSVWLVFAATSSLFAQAAGTITGRVTDATGAVVAGAAVTATNTGTAQARKTVTSSEGLYGIPALDPGIYDVKVQMTGFAPTVKRLTLLTGSTFTVDVALGVAGVTQEVSVTGEAVLVETTQSVVAGSLQTSEVQNLPMLNRNFVGLVTLVPGARPTTQANSNKIGFGGGISVGGGTGRNIELEVDGVAARDDVVGGTMFNFTLEGIQEFKVLSHEFGAQYGRTAGSVVLVASKAGANQFHGTAFAYGRNDTMTAIDFFTKASGFANPPYNREQFGGSFGGPIKKDKIFFFGAIERIQENRVKPYPANAFNQATALKQALLALGTPSGGAFPTPACPICVQVGTAFTPSQSSPQTIRDLMYTLKGDYQLNSHHSLFVRWAQQRLNSFNDLIVNTGAPPHPDTDPNGSNVFDTGRAYSIVGSETWVIGNNSVNTFAVQGNHLFTSQICRCGTPGTDGIYWLSRNLLFPSLQVGVSENSTDQDFYQTTVQFKDDFSHQMGKHSLKFGGDFSFFPRIGVTLAGAGGISQGATQFSNDPTTIIGSRAAWAANPSTCTTAAFVAGSPTACGKYKQGFLTPNAAGQLTTGQIMLGGAPGLADTLGQKQMGLYVQDDWKVKPGFTLNLGLRYDLNVNWYNQREYANNRTYLALKAIGSPYGALPHTPKKDFSPRVGFAWDIGGKGKNVLRASFGIFFDQMLMISDFPSALQEKATLNNQARSTPGSALAAAFPGGYVYGITDPLPITPTAGLTTLPPGKGTNGAWLDPNLTDPYNEQAHIGYTRQLSTNTVVSADYTHILGLRDFRIWQINPVENAWDPSDADKHISWGTRRLAPAFGATLGDSNILGGISLTTTTNRSRYDELTIHFEQRSKPMTFQGSYTLSSAYAFGGAISGATGGQGPLVAMNPDQPFAPSEWGPTLTDERHHVVLSGVFNLRWGIQASPIFQIASARPYNQVIPGAAPSGTGQVNIDRPINAATGQLFPVNGQRGTATWVLDARVTKFFNLWSEARKLGLFVEFYNLTNKANFGNNYNGNFGTPAFGTPLGYLNNGLSYPTSRQLQLGARFSF